jgi:hypothetical protein
MFFLCLSLFALLVVGSCKKESAGLIGAPIETNNEFITYLIPAGSHKSTASVLKKVTLKQMSFVVRFNQTAVYATKDSTNQTDINKLWGFSEGLDNQYNSARIGWAWVDNQLRLYTYVYNDGVRSFQQISAIPINADVMCNIAISGNEYIFTVDKTVIRMKRTAPGDIAVGLQQYPYFGGDEPAPHDISILLKSL